MLATARAFIYTSGLGVVGDTGDAVISDDTYTNCPPPMRWRADLERDTLASPHGVVVRPALVYGEAGGYVLRELIRAALNRGTATYTAPGENTWPNVHVDDLARLYRLALTDAPAGTSFNVVGGESTPRAVTEAIGRLTGRPVQPLDAAAALAELPVLAWTLATQRVRPSRAHELLGWQPGGADIITEIESGSYRTLLPKPQASAEPRPPLPGQPAGLSP
jgi:nucleoside-diphosphate-sugar epimerase